jgi:hypothetical protein
MLVHMTDSDLLNALSHRYGCEADAVGGSVVVPGVADRARGRSGSRPPSPPRLAAREFACPAELRHVARELWLLGRSAGVLQQYDLAGRVLYAEPGADPGPALRGLRRAIQQHDAPAPEEWTAYRVRAVC